MSADERSEPDVEPDVVVVDVEGQVLEVGQRVRLSEAIMPRGGPPAVGTVVEMSDVDGDVDDDTGRSILVPPFVTVRWDDGEVSRYRSYRHVESTMFEMKFEVEEVTR